jgi:solute carrier family 25 folate transporter 32
MFSLPQQQAAADRSYGVQYSLLPLFAQASSPLFHFARGAASKVAATTVTYPYQVLKSRLQARNTPYSGLLDATRKTLAREGIAGLFGGFGANLVRVVPGSAVTIATYELLRPLTS